MTDNPRVALHISDYGVITIELNPDKAPRSVANFLNYVIEGHYDGTIFHRVIGNFMIQGGGMGSDMVPKPCQAPIQNEANNGLKNILYSVAMARTADPHSATSQFFINVTNNSFLDHTSPDDRGWGYAVFGQVTDGTDVVNRIRSVATTRRGYHSDVPVENIVIQKAVVLTTATSPSPES